MKVCDRCKKELDTKKDSNLAGEKFELCLTCADYIARHIKTYKPKKKGIVSGIGEMMGGAV